MNELEIDKLKSEALKMQRSNDPYLKGEGLKRLLNRSVTSIWYCPELDKLDVVSVKLDWAYNGSQIYYETKKTKKRRVFDYIGTLF